jgi:tripartite-type tricarboxylate transporter receptor subunit TctC
MSLGLSFLALSGMAQTPVTPWPTRPVRLVVPATTGGPDTVARIMAPTLSANLGVPVVIDNRPGANGILGADLVAKSAPDGHTLMVYSSGFVVAPAVVRRLPYDTERDFVPVANLASNLGVMLVVNPAHPARTLAEFIALSRRTEANVSYSSPGIGNTLHLLGELLNAQAGLHMTHVPYKGGGPAVAAVMSGEVTAMLAPLQLAAPALRAGKLRSLGYSMTDRAPGFADIPTLREAGLPDYVADGGWFGLFAPAGTPAEIVSRLNAELRRALGDAGVRDRLSSLGFGPVGDSPDHFRQFVGEEIRRYAAMAKLAGIEPE